LDKETGRMMRPDFVREFFRTSSCGNYAVILRVCDFFECRQNRRCKQYNYDGEMDGNLKKSQTLSEAKDLRSCTRQA